jgi:superfamily II DNA or RNA helicase
MNRRRDILSKIAAEEEQCESLGKALKKAESRLAALREELLILPAEVETDAPVTAAAPLSSPISNASKMSLFRMLFRGREDVFPKRWENAQKKISGYSPACVNEWKHGLCDKKKVKCAECDNRIFIPVSDQVISEHLRGIHTIGVYPMLPDETCCFLAVDFDKSSWQEDALAFMETARTFDVHPAMERSRSGKGAHVWFFFATPIPAGTARRLGSFLITETMARRRLLSMESYDRLFPSQDTMPKGGFGNLIALPFQNVPRKAGNTLFVDDTFIPWPDQWAYLAAVPLIAADFVDSIVRNGSQTGRVMGACALELSDEYDAVPWMRPPASVKPKDQRIEGPLPDVLHAVLAQSIFVEKAGIPLSLLNRIQRLAVFQNPEFYKKQRMRLSTRGEPRIISCFENLPEQLTIPRGCFPKFEELLRTHGIALRMEDKRNPGESLDVEFHGELTPVQRNAASALLEHDIGIFVGPPGIGKTVLGTYLIAIRRRNTLVIVEKQQLLEQWISQLAIFLGIDEQKVGQLGGGKKKLNGHLDVAMMQSLSRTNAGGPIAEYGHIIVDECHHLSAFSYEQVLRQAKAKYIVGLTATPQRQDGRHPIIHMQLGPVRFSVDAKSQAARRPFDHKLIVRETGVMPLGVPQTAGIQDIYSALVSDTRRNDIIFDDIVRALEEKRPPILLTERREHLDHFAQRLKPFTRHLIVLRGGMKTSERKEVFERLTSIPEDEERLLLATGKYIGEGFDDARLDTLFLALPISWKGTLTQYTGRLHRLRPGKTEVRIYDYVDSSIPMTMSMFKKRLSGYRALGYARDESPLGIAPLSEEPTIEWDEEVLRDLEVSKYD